MTYQLKVRIYYAGGTAMNVEKQFEAEDVAAACKTAGKLAVEQFQKVLEDGIQLFPRGGAPIDASSMSFDVFDGRGNMLVRGAAL